MTADYNGWQDAPEEEREASEKTEAEKAEQAQKTESTDLRRSAVFAVVAVLAAFSIAGCRDSDAQQARNQSSKPPIAVRVAPVADTTLSRPIAATGTVAPKDEITLSFKVGGVIARIGVDPGDQVRAGQTLATLQLREIDAGLSKAQSGAAKAERDLARARRLYDDSVVTLAQMQDAETAAELARADLNAAAFNRRYAVIVAPANGTVLRRSAEPGETVDPGKPVLVLGSRARGSVLQVGLADRDVVSLRKGDVAIAQFDALPDKSFEGRVTEIGAAADPGTGAYGVEISLRDAAELVAGLVGRVEIHPAVGAPARLVPIEAVLEANGNEATVYALSPDQKRAERRRVTVAFIAGSSVALAGGLDGVNAVLTDGAAYLDDGDAVEVTP